MTGRTGERIAKAYLRLHGYLILDTNYHSRFGEIDIIAKKFETVVFVEVKTRGPNSIAAPAFAVDIYKQKKIIKTAQRYILYKHLDNCSFRFDVIELKTNGLHFNVNHIKNAFEGN